MGKPTNLHELANYLTDNPNVHVVQKSNGKIIQKEDRIFVEASGNGLWWKTKENILRFTPIDPCFPDCQTIETECFDDGFQVTALDDLERPLTIFTFLYKD